MAEKKTCTINYSLFDQSICQIAANERRTLVDFDIALFKPFQSEFNTHWKSELALFLEGGKTLFVFIPIEKLETHTNYRFHNIPSLSIFSSKINPICRNIKGANVTGNPIYPEFSKFYRDYNEFFEPYLSFVKSDIPPLIEFLTSTVNNQQEVHYACYSQLVTENHGSSFIVFLPLVDVESISTQRKIFNRDNVDLQKHPSFTKEQLESLKKFSTDLIKSLEKIDHEIRNKHKASPEPIWAQETSLLMKTEANAKKEITRINLKLAELEKLHEQAIEQSNCYKNHRRLLYETDKALEKAIRQAFETIGIETDTYQDDSLEIDLILKTADQILICEIEGPENIVKQKKLNQITGNIRLYAEKYDLDTPPVGLLIGNAFRKTPLNQRPNEWFSPHVIANAPASNVRLITTVDLYEVLRHYLNTNDPELKNRLLDTIIKSDPGLLSLQDLYTTTTVA